MSRFLEGCICPEEEDARDPNCAVCKESDALGRVEGDLLRRMRDYLLRTNQRLAVFTLYENAMEGPTHEIRLSAENVDHRMQWKDDSTEMIRVRLLR